MRLTYLTLGLPPTSEPETFKPYCQYGAEGERAGSFRWKYLVQSEEKAASLRCRGERGEVAPLIGVHGASRLTHDSGGLSFPVRPYRCSTSLLKEPGELPSLVSPRLCAGGKEKGQGWLLLFCGWRELRKETPCPGASVSTGAQLPRSSGWNWPWTLLS